MADDSKIVVNLATGLLQTRKLDQDVLVANADGGGATPLWNWIGDSPATVFSY
jgi:hypothetical protein